jgi:elongation factor Ts
MAGADTTVNTAREALISEGRRERPAAPLVRFDAPEGELCSYRHGVRIGVMVEMIGGDEELGRDIAMHIAATNPDVRQRRRGAGRGHEKEREIFRAQALESGKPPRDRRQDHRAGACASISKR